MNTAKLIGAALLLISTSLVHAQTAKVLKVSGRKAIVQTPPGTELKVGQTVSVGGDDVGSYSSMSNSAKGSVSGSRDYSIMGQFDFSSLTRNSSKGGSSSDTVSVFNLTAQVGWNKSQMEYGPRAGINNSNSSGTTTNSLYVGGFFDWNFVPNAPGTIFVYSAGGTADIGTASSAGSSGTAYTIFAGGNVKWFPFNNTAAVRADAGLAYGSNSYGSTTVTSTGIVVRAAFVVYL